MAGERRYIPASEFCASVRDGTHDSPKAVAQGRKLVTSRHLTTGRLDLSDAYLISEEDFEAINKRSKVDRWDVLISMIGTVGEPCLIKEEPDFAIKNIGLFKTKSEADGKWLYYFLRSKDAQQSIREQSRGTTQQYIPLGALRNFPILVADDPEEQKAIAAVLGALDDKIELNRRMNATLEAMARARFQSWFVDFDPVRAKLDGRPPAALDPATAALFPDSFQESALGEIPHGWRLGTLGELVQLRTDRVDATPAKDSTRYIALEDMPSKSIDLSNFQLGSAVNSSITAFRKGDVLFGSMRPYFHKVGLAFFDGITRTTTFVLRPRKDCFRHFALLHFFSDDVIAHSTTASVGTTIPYVRWDSMESYRIPIPPASLLEAFEKTVSPLVERIAAQGEESRTLATLRDTLLPKLLSGELSVAGQPLSGP